MPDQDEPKTVPLVIYKDGERVVIGEAVVQETEDGFLAVAGRITTEDPDVMKVMHHGQELYSLSMGPYERRPNNSSNLVFDRRDWETEQAIGRADYGSQTSLPRGGQDRGRGDRPSSQGTDEGQDQGGR